MGAIPEQAERDVHPDLGAAAREQGALAGEIGPSIPLGVVEGCAVGAQLVVEGVDERVVLLADVARSRLDERPKG